MRGHRRGGTGSQHVFPAFLVADRVGDRHAQLEMVVHDGTDRLPFQMGQLHIGLIDHPLAALSQRQAQVAVLEIADQIAGIPAAVFVKNLSGDQHAGAGHGRNLGRGLRGVEFGP